MCVLSRNCGASTSWNPKGMSRPVAGKLYLSLIYQNSKNAEIKTYKSVILCVVYVGMKRVLPH
jgi:hypothetical protein